MGFTFTSCYTLLQAIILCNFKENYGTKLEKMAKKLVSGPILAPLAQICALKLFSWILPLLDIRHCCKLSLHVISRKTNEPNLRKWEKNLVWDPILAHLAQIRAAIFFFFFFFSKIWLRQSLDIMVSYHIAQYQKKLMIQS